MAPKNQSRLLEDPLSASPSQEDEEEEEGEEEEEEELEESLVEKSVEEEFEEEQENEISQKNPHISMLSHMSQDQPGDESSEESEEEEVSETDNDNTQHAPTASTFIIKPAVNKTNHVMQPKKPPAKRALVNVEGRKDAPKKTKVARDYSQEDEVGTPKKAGSANGRVWNSDDVITILEGMIKYQKQKGADPHADMGAFLEFVKGKFGFEVTKTQLYEKVRSLKKKFVANLEKGESFIPTKPHDIACFELSKKIWGSNNVAGSVGNSDVANANDDTEHLKIIDGERVTKKSTKGKSSEGKRKEKGEKKKKVSENKKKKINNGPNIVEKEGQLFTPEDVMKDKEDVVEDYETVVEKEAEPETDEDVMKDKEDVEKDYTIAVEKEAEIGTDEDVVKDKEEDILMHNENGVTDNNNDVNNNKADKDSAQNISCKYPNLFASLSFNMPESQRKLMVEGICLVDSEKARELDNSWHELQIKEAEFHCRTMELMAEQSRLVVAALKKNK